MPRFPDEKQRNDKLFKETKVFPFQIHSAQQKTRGFDMAFDEKKYFKGFKDNNLSDEQKSENLQSMKKIFDEQIEIAFGTHPVQLCKNKAAEKYLQSPDVEVESKNLSKYFKYKSASKLNQKNILSRTNKESLHHVKPN